MFAPLFAYKAWANASMLEAILAIDGERFPEQRLKAIRVMNHTYVVDRIFAAHLLGETNPYAATNTEETPELAALAESIRTSDAWLAGYARELPAERLGERLRFRFTDGNAGEMSRAEMLQHLIVHGAYHRGAVGQILDALSLPRPADTINVYLHEAEPSRREHGGAAR
ncbi:damage-inducible protein DinB [Rhodanobacter sp. C06]|uniref:DinB family protein n=1 Tax=Rhodanobacter sp. C06 TaxID=1945854 RepID=UPI000985F5A6|nr:DinB family protein [Rhodanobacter sp. C06]OOG47259.1 damage-inducible protein DinB [Rhodanobacter sp. C06]